ncbi:hypothetical protein CEXT_806061 [Caerostris extrusa]|uniref:Uncharacterized protein n=1 Tax=Caerostris extrusa TaxID=172846 RepID=A0AAV4TVP3_CAEEX|nr:hypothetical protein CEXT_806061 [Caerostris extrusa]
MRGRYLQRWRLEVWRSTWLNWNILVLLHSCNLGQSSLAEAGQNKSDNNEKKTTTFAPALALVGASDNKFLPGGSNQPT